MQRRLPAVAFAFFLAAACSPTVSSTPPRPSASSTAASGTPAPRYVCVNYERVVEEQLKTTPPAGLGPNGAVEAITGFMPNGVCDNGQPVESTNGLCIITNPDPSTGRPAVTDVEPGARRSCKLGTFVMPANYIICVLYVPGLDRPIPAFKFASRVEAPPLSQTSCPRDWLLVVA